MPATIDTASIRTKLIADNKDFLASLDKSLGGVRNFANKASAAMKAAGKTLSLAVTVPILGAAVAAVKLGTDLDREMRNIQSVSKETDAEMAALSDTFVEMSTDITKTTDTAVGLAAGFYNIQGSGFAGAAGMKVLEAATKAASAGLTTTEVASGALTAALNAYGQGAESAQSFSDLLFRTVDVGVGTFEGLSNSIGYVVGTASQAGVSFDEVSAALATASKQGISFDKGARALNMLILALIDPSKEMADALGQIGFESGQAALDSMGLAGTLQALEQAGYGGTEGMASLGLSSMALRGALALTGEGAEMFEGDLAAMQAASEGAGATQEAFAIQTKSVALQMANAKNKLMALALGFSEMLLPSLLKVLGVAGQWLDKLLAMDDHTKKVILVVAGLAAALGPVLTIMGTVLGALLSPIGLIVIAVAGLAAAFATNFMGIRDVVMPVVEDVKRGLQALAAAFQAGGVGAAILELGEQVHGVIERAFGSEVAGKVAEFAASVRLGLGDLVAAFQEGGIEGALQSVGDAIQQAFGPQASQFLTDYLGNIMGFAETLKGAISSVVSAFREDGITAALREMAAQSIEVITSFGATMWAQLQLLGGALVDWIGPKIPEVVAKLQELAGKVLTWIGGQASVLADKFGDWAAALVDWIVPATAKFIDEWPEMLNKFLDWIEGAAGSILDKLLTWGLAFIDWVVPAIPGMVIALAGISIAILKFIGDTLITLAPRILKWAAAFYEWVETAKDKLKEKTDAFGVRLGQWIIDIAPTLAKKANQIGDALIEGIKSGLESAWEGLKAKVNEVIGRLPAAVRKFLGISSPSKVFMEIGSDIIAGLAQGIEAEGPEAVSAIANVLDDIGRALESIVAGFGALGEWEPIVGFRDKIAALRDAAMDAINMILGIGHLLGLAGHDYRDVEKVVKSIGATLQAAVGWMKDGLEAFASLRDYVSPAKANVEAFVADVGIIIEELVGIYQETPIHEFHVQWAQWAGALIGAVAGMVDDLRTIAAYKGDIEVSSLAVSDLVWALSAATYYIVRAMDVIPGIFDEGADAARQMYQSWLDFATGLVSTLAGAIEDLRAVAGFANDFTISSLTVSDLVWALSAATYYITQALKVIPGILDEGAQAARAMYQSWLDFATGMIATIVAAIEDLRTLAAYEGDIQVGFHEVQQLVWQIDVTARNILDAIGTVASDFQADDSVDQLKAAWLNFSAGLISTVAGAIEDLRTIAAYGADIQVGFHEVQQLVWQIDITARNILDAIGTVASDFNAAEGSVDQLEAAWLEFSAGLIATVAGVISDLETLAAFEGDLEVSTAGIENLVSQLEATATEILRVLNEAGVPDITTEGALEPLRAAWAEFAAGLVGAVAGAIDSLIAIGDYVGVSNIIPAVQKLVADLQGAINTITTELASVSWTEANAAATIWVTEAATLLGHIEGVVSSMEAIAAYEGESLAQQLRALVRNLAQAISYITTDFPTIVVTDDVIQLLADVQVVAQGIRNVLNALSGLSELSTEVPSLAEVGAQLVQALADGFIEATSTAAPAMMAALTGLLATVQGYLQSFAGGIGVAGWNMGSSLIQGMIDGLAAGTSALYQTIANIVAGAIGAANAAAGVASRSEKMWELGEQMRAGLTDALAAGTREASLAMEGLVSGAMVPAMAYAGSGGGAAGDTYSYEYSYHEAEGIGPDTRASLRQDFERLQFEERLRG